MAYLLQFFGLSDPLQLFYLQQSSVDGAGPVFTGFRPVQLDALMAWALETASCRQWDPELTQQSVMQAWICLLYTSPSPRDRTRSRMPSSA